MKHNETPLEHILKGSTELNQMFHALQRTATGLRRDFGEVEQLQQSLPGARDFVAKAATRIEQMILRDLQFVRPNAGILTPNMSAEGNGVSEFILALSGAENFVRGSGHFAITLALRVNGAVRAGLIYAPILDKLFYAENGGGTFIYNNFSSNRMRVSKLSDIADVLIAGKNRITGCPALDLAFVATGKFDGAIMDIPDFAELAAGELMITESGGKIWEDNGQIFVTNGAVKL